MPTPDGTCGITDEFVGGLADQDRRHRHDVWHTDGMRATAPGAALHDGTTYGRPWCPP